MTYLNPRTKFKISGIPLKTVRSPLAFHARRSYLRSLGCVRKRNANSIEPVQTGCKTWPEHSRWRIWSNFCNGRLWL